MSRARLAASRHGWLRGGDEGVEQQVHGREGGALGPRLDTVARRGASTGRPERASPSRLAISRRS